MQTARRQFSELERRMRSLLLIGLGIVMGSVPITVSGILELFTVVVAPFVLGFLIAYWWSDPLRQLTLAFAAGLFAAALKLLLTSMHSGKNWFGYVGGLVANVGMTEPVVAMMVLAALFPMIVSIVATAMFIYLKKLGRPSGPLLSVNRGSRSERSAFL